MFLERKLKKADDKEKERIIRRLLEDYLPVYHLTKYPEKKKNDLRQSA